MYNIILAVLLALLMARGRKPRRKFRRYLRGDLNETLALGTLATRTLIGGNASETVTEKTWVSSVVATWAMQGFTPASGDGPILVGLAHSDYSDAEIEAWVENSGSWSEGDLVSTTEVGRRKCKMVGIFRGITAETFAAVLNEGRPIRTKLNWMLVTGQTVKIWAFNLGSSALATTDPQIRVEGHANLWPR